MWTPPCGHCEPGEPIETCARRELREETRYECAELNALGSFIDTNVQGHPPYPLTVFWCLYDGLQALQCLEGQAVQFIERQRAANYEIPQYLIAIWDRAIAALRHECRMGTVSEEIG